MCRMQDCVCVSKLVVKQLWKYCPEVATYFAEDACLYNMTAAMLEEVTEDCDAFQTHLLS